MSSTKADRRRVLVLIKGLRIGGAEQLIAAAAPHWDRSEFDYRVAYLLPWKDHLVGRIEETGTEVTCIGGTGGMGVGALRRLEALSRQWGASLIHAHLPWTGILARLAGGAPVVYTEHNLAGSYRLPTRLANRATYGRNAAVIAVSEAVAASLAGYPGPTPRVIPNGVETGVTVDGSWVRQELGIDETRPLVVHVGNIRPHKGHRNLIAAVALLRERVPDVAVVSIGAEKRNGDIERLRAESSAVGVDDHLRFLGRRPDATAFLAAADVVVSPSDIEGLPVTILEAMAMGRPVVATDVGGVATVVEHEKTGLLVPPGDSRSLAGALERTLAGSDAREWAQAGADRVARDYGIEKMVRLYETVYREVLG